MESANQPDHMVANKLATNGDRYAVPTMAGAKLYGCPPKIEDMVPLITIYQAKLVPYTRPAQVTVGNQSKI